MLKKIAWGCFTVLFGFTLQNVSAASTCSYEEQVELNNLASTVKAGYEIKKVVTDMDGNVLPNVKEEEATEDSDYILSTRIFVYALNITDDIYVTITSDKGLEKTYHYSDTNNGEIKLEGGNLTEIINYKVTVYSNKNNCRGESFRTIEFVTPMKNRYSSFSDCAAIPNFEYCQTYITVPFLASEYEIQNSIDKEYQKVKKQQIKEEQKEKSIVEKLKDFYIKNKMIIYSFLGVVVVVGVLTTIVIIKKRRSRIL